MKWIGLTGIIAAPLLLAAPVAAGTSPVSPQVGDTYELVMTTETEQTGSRNGSSGSSHGRDTIVERVVALRADGLELEYDLPDSATADDRTRVWQFPARVFKPVHGQVQLLNSAELEARVDRWLKAAELPRAACGHWIFTWNAFRIECDPQSVLKTVESFDMRSAELRDGASYQAGGAGGPGTLTKREAGDGAVFTVEMPVDPDAVRHTRAESDVVVGEIMRQPVTLDAALRKHASDAIVGTISVTFETDHAGNLRRRTRVTKLRITGPDGQSEAQTTTETLERRLISHRD